MKSFPPVNVLFTGQGAGVPRLSRRHFGPTSHKRDSEARRQRTHGSLALAQRALAGWLCLSVPAVAAAHPAHQGATLADLQARAATAREAGKLDEALSLYRSALTLNTDWDEGRWYVATLLYELERYSEASEAFSGVLRRQPTHAGAMGLRGLCEFQLQRYERALVDLLQAGQMGVSQSPGIASVVRYHAAVLLTRFGDFEVANQMLSDLVATGGAKDDPSTIEAFGVNVLRMPLLPAELPAEARDRVTLAGRAGYAMAARQVEAARGALDQLVARYAETPHVHYVKGVFLLTDDGDRALAEFRRELEISPTHVPARLQMAFEYLKRGDPDRAQAPAREAAKLSPDHFAARLALGQVLLELDDSAAALVELEKAAELAPDSPQPQFMLARAYARAGRPADAQRARAEFTRLDQIARAARQGQQSIGGIPR